MRKTAVPALDKLIKVAGELNNSYLKKAKNAGKKIVGIMCDEIPEEILMAAGCVPVLLRGTGADGTEYAEAYFRPLTCNYTRCTFNQILSGAWDFLDGAVIFNSCDHMRRVYDNWQLLPENKAYHFIYAPKKGGNLSREFYREEVRKFVAATEKKFGVEITSEKISEAIRLQNEIRKLQQRLYDLQKGKAVYLTGAELLMVMLAGVSMPREDYLELLKELLEQLKASGETFTPEVRLLYTGGHADSREFFDMLETNGAQIVTDAALYGSDVCEVLVSEDGDPLVAVSDYYFEQKPASPRKFGTAKDRMERLDRLVKEFSVDGVVMIRVSSCDVWAAEQYMARDHLQQTGVPFLELEVDYLPEGQQGQLSTRVQAFVESINAKKAE